MYQSRIENVKRDKTLSKGEKDSEIASCQKELEQAKAVEAQNKDQIAKLIGKAENYLKNNFDKYDIILLRNLEKVFPKSIIEVFYGKYQWTGNRAETYRKYIKKIGF